MLSVVLPTYNEAENLPILIEEIEEALSDVPYEVIVVDDDSSDKTWEVAELLAEQSPHLRVLRRVGRRGLSSAAIEGFTMAAGDVLALMDADGQHDPHLLPVLYKAVKEGAAIAVGSRYVPGGSVEGWAKPRHTLSVVATGIAWLVCSVRVRDPMSGFFALSASTFKVIVPKLHPRGFKILLEILSWLPRGAKAVEIPLVLRVRRRGESKLSMRVQRQFLEQVLSLLWKQGKVLFWLFIMVIVLVGGMLALRVWRIRAFYLSADVRTQLERVLRETANDHGWILSDLSLQAVTRTGVTVMHREHQRGKDAVDCFVRTFDSPDIQPCAVL